MGEGFSAVVMVVMMESMLMQRLEQSTTEIIGPIQAMYVLALAL